MDHIENSSLSETVSDAQSDVAADCKTLRILDVEVVPEVLKREPVRELQLPSDIEYSKYLEKVMERAAEDELITITIHPSGFGRYPYLYQDLCEDSYRYLSQEEIYETAMRTVAGDETVDRYVKLSEEKEGEFLWDEHCWDRLLRAGMQLNREEHPDAQENWKDAVYAMEEEQYDHVHRQIREWARWSGMEWSHSSIEYLVRERGGFFPEEGYAIAFALRLTVEELLDLNQLAWLLPRSDGERILSMIEIENELKCLPALY